MTIHISSRHTVVASRAKGLHRARLAIFILAAALVAVFFLSLSAGTSYLSMKDVLQALSGDTGEEAYFIVMQLRLPRAVIAVLAGCSFALGGAAFQSMLRNPLASPDIVGISSGASAAAVIAIVVFALTGTVIQIVAVIAGLGVALLIYILAYRDRIVSTRLILIGIGVSAMLDSVTAYVLAGANGWTLQEALRWLTGSVNGARLDQAIALSISLTLFGSMLLFRSRDIDALRLGDETAAALGTPIIRTRVTVIIASVGLISVATALTGPIAFVAFLSGPIAARIVGQGALVLIPSALFGALLVLAADYCGQHFLPTRYPVGVVTGALGAPYLLYLIVRANRMS